MQPDRAPTRALRLSRGLFGAGPGKAVPAADPKRRETDEAEEDPNGLKHLFGR
jgi:hypothetical protein